MTTADSSCLNDSFACRLVACLQAGDIQAVEQIWDSFGADLRRRARTRLRQYGLLGHTEAMDICNAVLLDLVRQSSFKINDPRDLMRYIRRAIDNQVRDEFKLLTRQRRDIRRTEKLPVENHNLHQEKSSPSQIMIRNEIFDRISRQLGDEGELLLQLVLQEFTWEEIGKKLSTRSDTVRMRWNRAVKAVQLQMLTENEEPR